MEEVEKNAIHWEDDPYITKLREEYTKLKIERRDLVAKMAEICKVKHNKIPFSTTEKLNAFVNQHLGLKGFKSKKGRMSPIYFKEHPDHNQINLKSATYRV